MNRTRGTWIRPRVAKRFVWRNNQAAFAFGKHNGQLLKQVALESADYLEWIRDNLDMPPDTRRIVVDALKEKFPKRLKAS